MNITKEKRNVVINRCKQNEERRSRTYKIQKSMTKKTGITFCKQIPDASRETEARALPNNIDKRNQLRAKYEKGKKNESTKW